MECVTTTSAAAAAADIKRGNLPRSLWRRETGDGLMNKYHSYKKGFACQEQPKNFSDLQCRALKGLKTAPCLSLPINAPSVYETVPIYSLEKAGDRLIAADESGKIHVIHRWFQNDYRWESDKAPVKVTSSQVCEKSAVYSVKYMNDKIFAGTGAGNLYILDSTSLDLIRTYTCHEKSIKKVDSFTGDILVTCSRDNSINFHDLRIKSIFPVNRINDAHCVISKDSSTNSRHHKAKAAVISAQSSPSNSVTDIVYIDENNLISSGASDGLLKQWDFRTTYKHLKKYHPVEIIEYPGKNNNKGYGSLKVWNSKLYASSVQYDIFQFDLNTMQYETSYTSPSPMSFYTRLDVSRDGQFLASGSEEPQVHIFKTKPFVDSNTKTSVPVHSLVHDGVDPELGVCCPVFDPHDDLVVTTGGDTSVVMKWIPEIYLENDFAKQDSVSETLANKSPSIKSEFQYIHRHKRSNYYRGSPKKCPSGKRLDSFPNYVIDGLTLPHVVPKIKIKLRKKHICPNDWLTSPESSNRRKTTEETTPKSRSGRKRRKFSDDESSPKISKYFKLISLPHTISEH